MVTGNHPVWQAVEGRWLPAEKLLVGDWVHDADGAYLRVASIATVQRTETVHNLEVEGLHTFFVATEAGGDDAVLVHNANSCHLDLSRVSRETYERRLADFKNRIRRQFLIDQAAAHPESYKVRRISPVCVLERARSEQTGNRWKFITSSLSVKEARTITQT